MAAAGLAAGAGDEPAAVCALRTATRVAATAMTAVAAVTGTSPPGPAARLARRRGLARLLRRQSQRANLAHRAGDRLAAGPI